MHLRTPSDHWDYLQTVAASSLNEARPDAQLRLLKALYALPEPVQERPDFDSLERVILDCNWSVPEAREELQCFVNDFISRNRLSKRLTK